MIAAFKSFKHGMFKTLCLNLQDAFGKRNPMLTASDYNVVRVFFFRLNFPALEPVGDNSHLCEPQNFFNLITISSTSSCERLLPGTSICFFSSSWTNCSTLQLSVRQSLISGLFPSSQCFFCWRFNVNVLQDRLSIVEQEATVECLLHLRSHLHVRQSQESQWF